MRIDDFMSLIWLNQNIFPGVRAFLETNFIQNKKHVKICIKIAYFMLINIHLTIISVETSGDLLAMPYVSFDNTITLVRFTLSSSVYCVCCFRFTWYWLIHTTVETHNLCIHSSMLLLSLLLCRSFFVYIHLKFFP